MLDKGKHATAQCQMLLKSAVDFVVAALALIVLSPLLALIAIAIKLDSRGPVLFRQERLGRHGGSFTIYKFRTMYVNASTRFREDGTKLVTKNDPRVTRVGRLLRVGLDELPQLINVIKGEMSLVGPRPDEIYALSMYSTQEARKLKAKPGLVGLAVVRGRNMIPWRERVRYDVEYVENWSLWLDIKIVLSVWKGFLYR